MAMPITDTHMHLSPNGRGAEAVKDFIRAGGTHIILANKPYGIDIRDPEGFRDEFGTTLTLAEEARTAGAVVHTIVGPHPVHYTRLLETMERDDAHGLMMSAMEIAASMVEDGDAVGIGEVGMPHFPVEPRVREDSKGQLLHAMELAADLGCPVIVHSETTDGIYAELSELAGRAGLPAGKLVKHYAPPVTAIAGELGMFLSILAKEENILRALDGGDGFMLETDYIDDPRRPGAVLGPKTVPKVTRKMLEKGTLTEEQAHLIHDENPSDVFGIDIEV
jgi:TatD-related deoxyribonuclease